MYEKKNSLIAQEIELLIMKGTGLKSYPEASVPLKSGKKLPKVNIRAVLYAMIACLFQIFGNVLKKWTPDVPVPQLLCIRSVYALIPITAMIIVKKQTRELRDTFTIPTFLVASTRALCNICYFSALISLSGSEVVTILSTNTLVVGFMAAIVLHEPYENIEKVLGLVSFGGVLIIVRPPFLFGTETPTSDVPEPELSRYVAGIITLLSVMFHAINVISIRAWKHKFPPWVMGFHIQFNPIIIFGLYILVTGSYQPMSLKEHWAVFLSGMCTLITIQCNVTAWQLEKPSVIAVVGYSGLLFSLVLDILLLGEIPSFLTCIGAALIVGSCLYIIKAKNSNKK